MSESAMLRKQNEATWQSGKKVEKKSEAEAWLEYIAALQKHCLAILLKTSDEPFPESPPIPIEICRL